MNSTPISDDELDIDDSVSLSSNADGSCTSPQLSSAAQMSDKNGNFFIDNCQFLICPKETAYNCVQTANSDYNLMVISIL